MEIIIKDIAKPKLTLTPTRVTLKFPLGTAQEIIDKYVGYTNEITKVFTPSYSYRGDFREIDDEIVITLKTDTKTKLTNKFTFKK